MAPIALGLAILAGSVAPSIARADTDLHIIATSPGDTSTVLNGSPQILVRFSEALSNTTVLPSISPSIDGTWQRIDRQLLFTPAAAWPPDSTVTVTVPGKLSAAGGSTLARTDTFAFKVGDGSLLRAEQLLARLNYLPVRWKGGATPTLDEYERAAFDPPRGHFTFIGQTPHQLQVLWKPGAGGRVWASALSTFENDNNLPVTGTLSGAVWSTLLADARHPAAHRSRTGFTFAVANQRSPETLTIWRGGSVVLNTLANSGITLAPTADGLFAVYAKLRTQIMRGVDPSGEHYADPVSWISYFNGSDAVHYFDRPGYGYRQSLGCVEVPLVAAEKSYGYLKIGTLISVIN